MAVLAELAVLFGKAAESLSKLGDGFAHLVELSVQAYDGVAARNSYNELIGLRARLENMAAISNRPFVESIEQYIQIARDAPPRDLLSEYWESVIARANLTLTTVNAVLEQTNEIRSDFVLQDAYRSILSSLSSRKSIIEELRGIQAPQTEEELNALGAVATNYRKLMVNLQKASDELAAYIKTL